MSVNYLTFSEIDIAVYDCVVVGAGLAGSLMARELADGGNNHVLVIEKLDRIGGICADKPDGEGAFVPIGAPHVFCDDDETTYRHLERFTEWRMVEGEYARLYRCTPENGWSAMFDAVMSHPLIDVCLDTEAASAFGLEFTGDEADAPLSRIIIKGYEFNGPIVFTGTIDELFLWRFGRLPYVTSEEAGIPASQLCIPAGPWEEYPLTDSAALETYERYAHLVEGLSNFYLVGRLADYHYYNMSQITRKVLKLSAQICNDTEVEG